MSEQRDPARWLDAEGQPTEELGELGELLKAGADELPGEVHMEAIASQLGPSFQAAGATTAGGASTGAAAGSGAPWSILVVTALAVGAIAWMMLAPEGDTGARTGAAPEAEGAGQAEAEIETETGAETGAQAETGAETETKTATEAETETKTATEAQVARRAAPPDPAAELLLLDRAQRALGSDPRRALAAAREHRRRFPRGQYVQEREVITIEALIALGRSARAEHRAQRFLARHPDSSYARKIRKLFDPQP